MVQKSKQKKPINPDPILISEYQEENDEPDISGIKEEILGKAAPQDILPPPTKLSFSDSAIYRNTVREVDDDEIPISIPSEDDEPDVSGITEEMSGIAFEGMLSVEQEAEADSEIDLRGIIEDINDNGQRIANPNLKNEIPLDVDNGEGLSFEERIPSSVTSAFTPNISVKNPFRLLKTQTIKIGKVTQKGPQGETVSIPANESVKPNNNEIINAALDNIDHELVIARNRYKQETGRDIVTLSSTPDMKFENGEWIVQFAFTEGTARILNTYAKYGLKAAEEEGRKVGKEYIEYRKAYNTEQEKIDAFIKEHPYITAINLGIEDTKLAYAQLAHNAKKLTQGIYTASVYGFDSKEYDDLIEEDKREQGALNIAGSIIPKTPEEGGTTAEVIRGASSVAGQVPKIVAAGRGLPFLVFLESAHRGVPTATRDAFLTIPQIAAGRITGGILGEKVVENSYSMGSRLERQILSRISEGGTNVLAEFAANPSQYLNGNKPFDVIKNIQEGRDIFREGAFARGTTSFLAGAAFPIGKVGDIRPAVSQPSDIVKPTLELPPAKIDVPMTKEIGIYKTDEDNPLLLKPSGTDIRDVGNWRGNWDDVVLNYLNLKSAKERGLYKTGELSKDVDRLSNLNKSIEQLELLLPKEWIDFVKENEVAIREAKRGGAQRVAFRAQVEELHKNGHLSEDESKLATFDLADWAKEGSSKYGSFGRNNKFVKQETAAKDIANAKASAKNIYSGNLNDATAILGWMSENAPRAIRLAAFYIEAGIRDFSEFVNSLKIDIGEDIVNAIGIKRLQQLFDDGKKFYESNNADPFFSGLKQNIIERFPDGNINANTAKNIIEKLGTATEIEWTTGLRDYINNAIRSGKKINKRELLNIVNDGQVRVDEVILGAKNEEQIDIETQIYEINTQLSKEDNVINEVAEMLKDESPVDIRAALDYNRRGFGQERYDRILNAYEQARANNNYEIAASNFQEAHRASLSMKSVLWNRLQTLRESTATRYDLKTYTAEKLELEGGENPREVLLQVPSKKAEFTSFQDWLDENSRTRAIYETGSDGERDFLRAQYERYKADFENRNVTENYDSPHWSPHENIIAHFRANERNTVDGNNVFHAEEFQSDWNQQGRKEGYKPSKNDVISQYNIVKESESSIGSYKKFRFTNKENPNDWLLTDAIDEASAINHVYEELNRQRVPKNPLMEKNWKELAFKRFLRMGIEMGKDGVSWTTARQQQERYNKLLEGKVIDIYKDKNDRQLYFSMKGTDIEGVHSFDELENVTNKDIRDLAEQQWNNHLAALDRAESYKNIKELPNNFEVVDMTSEFGRPKFQVFNKGEIIGDVARADFDAEHGQFIGDGATREEAINDALEGLRYLYEQDYANPKVRVSLSDSIKIGKGYSDYDTYFVNLAKKIGKRFGAEYKVKEIETSRDEYRIDITDTEEVPYIVYPLMKEGKKIFFINEETGLQEEIKTPRDAELKAQDNIPIYYYDSTPKTEQVHYLEITPSMRESLKSGFPLYGIGLEPLPKGKEKTGIRNRIVPREEYNTILKEIIELLEPEVSDNGTILNTGLNPSSFAYQARLLYKGIKDSQEFASRLVSDFGDWIAPYVDKIWDFVHEFTELPKLTPEQSARISEKRESGEGGFLNITGDSATAKGKRKSVADTGRNILANIARSITIAQFNSDFRSVYEGMRDVRLMLNGYSSGLINTLRDARELAGYSVGGLRGKANPKVAEAIYSGNEAGKVYTDSELQILFSLDANGISAYRKVRQAQDDILRLREKQDLYKHYRSLGRLTSGSAAHTNTLNKISQIQAHYNNLRNSGYVSLQRRGRIAVYAEDINFPVGDSRRTIYTHAKNWNEARIIEKDFKRQGFQNLRAGQIRKLAGDLNFMRKLTPGQIEDLIASAGVNPHDPNVKAIRDEIYSRYSSYGYQIKRNFTRGYKVSWKNLMDTMIHQAETYSSSFYNNIARENALDMLNASGLANSDAIMYNITKSYIEDETTPPSQNIFNRISSKARIATYITQMGLDVTQFFLNAMQPIVTTYSHLAKTEQTGIKGIAPEATFVKAMYMTSALLGKKVGLKSKTLTPEFIDFYKRAKDEDVVAAELTESLASSELGVGTKLQKVSDWTSVFMKAGEKVARTHAFIAGFLIGKKRGYSGDTLYNFAVDVVKQTQGEQSSGGENPRIIRQAGELGKLFYQFGSFTQIWFENLATAAKSDIKTKTFKGLAGGATARHLGALGLVSGIVGMPLSASLRALLAIYYNEDKKDDIERWAKNNLEEYMSSEKAETLKNIALYGISGRAGIANRIGIRVPIFDSAVDTFTTNPDYLDSIPAIRTAEQVSTGIGDFIRGDYARGFEGISPRAAKNIIKTFRFEREGMRERKTLGEGGKGDMIIPAGRMGFPSEREFFEDEYGNRIMNPRYLKSYASTDILKFPNYLLSFFGIQPPNVSNEYEKKKFDMLGTKAKNTKRSIKRQLPSYLRNN